MSRLVQRIELDQPAAYLGRGGQVSGLNVFVGKGGEHFRVAIDESLPPRDRPVGVTLLGERLAGP